MQKIFYIAFFLACYTIICYLDIFITLLDYFKVVFKHSNKQNTSRKLIKQNKNNFTKQQNN